MAFEKVVYEDNVTVIRAAQLNAIQDEIIRVAEEVDDGGLVGPQGPKGDTGATGQDGKSINWRGEYKGNALYNPLDAVSYEGSVYIAASSAIGAIPGIDEEVWSLMAEKGNNGDPGIVISSTQPTDSHHPVWINPEGDASAEDVSLGVLGAAVGQIAKISAVDENGVPTAWESVDLPSGGGGETWEKIGDVEFSPDTSLYIVANFATWKKVKLLMNRNAYISGLSKNVWCKFYKGTSEYASIGYMTTEYGYVHWEFSAEVNNLFAESLKNASNNRSSSTNITSTGFYILDNVSPDELSIGIRFTDTSVIQTGDKITVLGVRR